MPTKAEFLIALINFIVRGFRLFQSPPAAPARPPRRRSRMGSAALNFMRSWMAPRAGSVAFAALSADRATATKQPGMTAYPVAIATTIYKGSMVCLNSSGYAVPAADTSGYSNVMGVAYEKVVNSGANGALKVRVESGIRADFAASSITQAMLGTVMFVIDDQTFDNTSSNGIRAGILTEFVSTTRGWLLMREPATTPGSVGTSDIAAANVTVAKLSASQQTGFIPLPLSIFRLIASNDIAAKNATDGGTISSDTAPIFGRVNAATDKQLRITWAATIVIEITAQFPYPHDIDDASALTVNLLMGMGGASDTPLIGVNFWEGVGDTNAGGNTSALAAAVAQKTVAIAASDVGAYPKAATIGIIPAAHGTDAVYLYAAWITYLKKD